MRKVFFLLAISPVVLTTRVQWHQAADVRFPLIPFVQTAGCFHGANWAAWDLVEINGP